MCSQHRCCATMWALKTMLSSAPVITLITLINGPQCPHMDYLLAGHPAKKLTIVAAERAEGDTCQSQAYSLHLYPRSHTVMRDAASFDRWSEIDGFEHSAEELDRQFSMLLPIYEPVHLIMKPGQILICDGCLVHGGGLMTLHHAVQLLALGMIASLKVVVMKEPLSTCCPALCNCPLHKC